LVGRESVAGPIDGVWSIGWLGELLVAAVCDLCGNGPGFGMSVSHSHRRTRRRWNPNIQTVRALVGRTPKKLAVCTSCIKSGKVARA
jgi:large subunit ribosomal protein L28